MRSHMFSQSHKVGGNTSTGWVFNAKTLAVEKEKK